MACTPATASCSTMKGRPVARPSSPARSPGRWRRSPPAGRTASISATSPPGATGAMPAAMSRACGGCCSSRPPTTTCWPPARATRCASSSSSPSARSGGGWSGRARASTSTASTPPAATPWCASIRATSGPPRSISCSAIRARRRPGWAGATPPASRRWSPRWSRPISPPPTASRGVVTPATEPFRLAGRRVWVAGHRGMVGSALLRRLSATGCEVVTAGRDRVDLRRQTELEAWLAEARPAVVIVAAATVGGILANATRPAEFLYDNLAIEANIVEAARRVGIAKLLLLGSSCIYPKLAPQPIPEDALLTGPLEPTNEWYAIAKIAGIKLCQAYRRQYGRDFISAMPTNLYGPQDNFDLTSAHVVPALMRKFHEARNSGAADVEIWGSGRPRREFLHVDDAAAALVHLLEHYSDERQTYAG